MMKGIFLAVFVCAVSANLANLAEPAPVPATPATPATPPSGTTPPTTPPSTATPTPPSSNQPAVPPTTPSSAQPATPGSVPATPPSGNQPTTPPMVPAPPGSVGCPCTSKYWYNKTDCSGTADQQDGGIYATNCAVNLNGDLGYTKSYKFNDDCTALLTFNTADCSGAATSVSTASTGGKCFEERLASSSGSEIVTCTKTPQKPYPLTSVCKLIMGLYGDANCTQSTITYHSTSYFLKTPCNSFQIGKDTYYIKPAADCSAGQVYTDATCTTKKTDGVVWNGKCDKNPVYPGKWEKITVAPGNSPSPPPSAPPSAPSNGTDTDGASSLLPSVFAAITVLVASFAM